METRSGSIVPFLEEEKQEKVTKPCKIETRKDTIIPLLNEPCIDKLNGSKLPTRKDVFFNFFYLHNIRKPKLKLSKAKREAVKETSKIWKSVGLIPKKIDNGAQGDCHQH